ncbi:MAG: hypothetical protein CO119_03955 [Flavobacteriales bacterium CG_4_9_14_3_um_filter_40_17]|nr:MAG: hypothetical protein CO119_03955 [Flavobacteriales bacterium CG_4_9_14_3_um_filter_40_17]
MKQTIFTTSVFLFTVSVFIGCSKEEGIIGTWKSDYNQTLILKANNEALWLIDSHKGVDTYQIKYRYDETTQPNHFDLYDFKKGVLIGFTLYGITEMKGKTLKLNFEVGENEQVRPKSFDPQETQVFYKE